MSKLVSVIIPCFNAQRWLAEAIDSCLQQTYPNIEIIVIDDGSTDRCGEILASYGDRIIWESGRHRGGNYGRNRGFALSRGEYIQYLDADDYILPEKIARQVQCLEETGADVVYSDWRFQHHLPNGASYLDKIEIAGAQADILEALLADWWVATAARLFRRTAVKTSGGWDESLKAGQDRDFFISVVMNGAKVVYQPGCDSIYRIHDKVTVSTASRSRWLEGHHQLLQKVEIQLSQANRLSNAYRCALAKSYYYLAREFLYINCYWQYSELTAKILILSPEFQPQSNRAIYKLACRVLGFRLTERLACFLILVTRKSVIFLNLLCTKLWEIFNRKQYQS